MSSRGARWTGGAVAAVAAAGLAVYFFVVGLEQADMTASVLGAFIGLAGLCLSVYAMVRDRAASSASGAGEGPASPEPAQPSGGVVNTIKDSTITGIAIQAQTIGAIDLSGAVPSAPRPDLAPALPEAAEGQD